MNTPQSAIHEYHGRCMRIDVSKGESIAVPLDATLLRSDLGGAGLGVAILLREQSAVADELSPEAALAFVFSPLRG